MPASSSKMRTVPGSNVGPAGGSGNEDDGGGSTTSGPPSDVARATMPKTATRATTARPTTQPTPLRRSVGGGSGGAITPELTAVVGSGASTGECWTATPGPA